MINKNIYNKIIQDLKKAIPISICVIIGLLIISEIFGTACYFKFLCGLPCPACGITRAFKLLLQLKFKAAFFMHPMIYPVVLWFAIFIVSRYFSKNKIVLKYYSILCITLFILLYIYRMIYVYPNAEPMEYFPNNILNFISKLQYL